MPILWFRILNQIYVMKIRYAFFCKPSQTADHVPNKIKTELGSGQKWKDIWN